MPARYPLYHLLLLLALCAATGSHAKSPELLNIGFQRETHPFSYIEQGRAQGVEIEIVREAVTRAGYTPRVHVVTLQRLLHQLQTGSLDIGSIFTLPSSPFGKNAKNTLVYAKEHLRVNVYLYAKQDKGIELQTLADMLNYRLGQHESAIFYRHPSFPNSRPVRFFRNYQLAFTALQHDRVDIVTADDLSLSYALQKNPQMQSAKITPIYHIDSGSGRLIASQIALGERAHRISEDIFNALQQMKIDGSIKRILQKHQLDDMLEAYYF